MKALTLAASSVGVAMLGVVLILAGLQGIEVAMLIRND
jgi:hypothetical protein